MLKVSLGIKRKGKLKAPRRIGASALSAPGPSSGEASGASPMQAKGAVAVGKGRSSSGQVGVVKAPPPAVVADDAEPDTPAAPDASGANAIPLGQAGAPKSEIEMLLAEMKGRQARGEHLASATQARPGRAQGGDPTTTNIFVSNLAPTTTEEDLRDAFARFGPLVSVKVMWPRTDEERARGSNRAFVAYHRRPDAEKAITSMQGETVGDGSTSRLRLAWSRAVKGARGDEFPGAAEAAAPGGSDPPADVTGAADGADAASPAAPGDPLAAAPHAPEGVWAKPPIPPALPPPPPAPEGARCAQVLVPPSRWQRRVVDRLAWEVARFGPQLEEALRERVVASGAATIPGLPSRAGRGFDWSWLLEQGGGAPEASSVGLYYRWRVWLAANAIAEARVLGRPQPRARAVMRSWAPDPFRFSTSGVWVRPPSPPHRAESADLGPAALVAPSSSPAERIVASFPLPAGTPLCPRSGCPLRRCFLESPALFRGRWRGWDWAPSGPPSPGMPPWAVAASAAAEVGSPAAPGPQAADALAVAAALPRWRSVEGGGVVSARAGAAAVQEEEDDDAGSDRDDDAAWESDGTWSDEESGAPGLPATGGGTGEDGGASAHAEPGAGGRHRLDWPAFVAWVGLLRHASLDVGSVRARAVWALDHAECAAEVAVVLCDSVCTPPEATPLGVRLARLMVLSDVLLAGVGASGDEGRDAGRRLREAMLPCLPRVAEALGEALACVPHRMRRGAAAERVGRVLAAWRRRAGLLPSVIDGFEASVARPWPILDEAVASTDARVTSDVWCEATPHGRARTRTRAAWAAAADKLRREGAFRIDAPLPRVPGGSASDLVALAVRLRRAEQVQPPLEVPRHAAGRGAAEPGQWESL